jgi:hypothetical protein
MNVSVYGSTSRRERKREINRASSHEHTDTLRVRHRDTPSSDTPVVTGFGEGARQKILIHQVFDRSVKVWSRCEGLFYPMFLDPVSLEMSFSKR